MGRTTLLQTDLTKKISELGFVALEITEPDEFKREVLTRMERLFGATDSLFLNWTPVTNRKRQWIPSDMFSPNWERNYRQHYYRNFSQDPVYKWIQSGKYKYDLSVTRFSALTNFKDFRKTKLYSELMLPLKHRYVLSMALNDGTGIFGNISLLRPKTLSDFDTNEIQIAQAITPMIISACRNITLEQQLKYQGDLVDVLHNHSATPCIAVLSNGLETDYISAQTTELISQLKCDDINNINDLLFRSTILKKYLDTFSAMQESYYKRLPTQLSDTIELDKKYLIHIEFTLHKQHNSQYYLAVTFNKKNNVSSAREEHNTFNLTMRELQVAQLASKGLTSEEISGQLCISKWSIKNHLKNIYAKTGVNNRTALSCLIR